MSIPSTWLHWVLNSAFLFAALLSGSAHSQYAPNWQLTAGALVHPDYRGSVPSKSDVIFSTRFKRDNAPDVARSFGATRIEWVYSTDREYIRSLKNAAGWFGGSLNANIHLPNDDGVARDFEGNLLVAPWMKAWGAKWVTTNHPDTVNAYKNEATKIIEAGAASIQFDDPLLQLHSASWGAGDFNAATLRGFNKYISEYPDRNLVAGLLRQLEKSDYREYLKSNHGIRDAKDYISRYRSLPTTGIWFRYLRHSVRQFFAELRSHLSSVYGQPFPLSMNLAGLDWPNENRPHFFLTEFSDYVIAETPIANFQELVVRAATARALGVGFVPSLMPRDLADNRVAIATLYALGAQPLVPWDIYDGNDERGQAKRFFGTPEDYGSLYAFVRNQANLFDNAESTAVVGIPVPVDKFKADDTLRLVRRLVESQVPFAFILAGGTERKFSIDPNRARHFKLIVGVNPETDFATEDLAALRATKVPRFNSSELTDSALRDLAPVTVVGGIGAVKVYPRAKPVDGGRNLLIHVVDEPKGALTGSDADCQRRIGLKKAYLGNKKIAKATWHSEKATTPVTVSSSNLDNSVTIRECRLWGVLSLSFD